MKADIKLALPRALAVEGRVIDEFGDPMADVSVTARSEGGLAFAGQSVSDDRGRFRLYGLPVSTPSVRNRDAAGGVDQHPTALRHAMTRHA